VGFFAQEEAQNTDELVGVDINTGEACIPLDEGIVDNYCVKRQLLKSCTMIASSLLLVDEVMRAGLSSLKQ
jgi:T-complex protein 1 subunit zeta